MSFSFCSLMAVVSPSSTAFLASTILFLAAVGIYGIINYSTQLRRFELGTRMAIGAKAKDLMRLIISDNLAAILIGVVASIIILLILYIGFSEILVAI